MSQGQYQKYLMILICSPSRSLAILILLMTGKASGYKEEKLAWDPVSVFKIQWILNAGLPEGKLCLSRSEFQSFYLTDGNVIVGRKEIETDSFYVIEVEQDTAEQIPSKESMLLFKRDVRDSK